MSVLYSCDELYVLIAELSVKIFYENIALLRGKMPSVVVFYSPVCQSDDVATHCHIVRPHVISY